MPRPTAIRRTHRSTPACATRCSRRCSRPDQICCCCRFRTFSAGAIASTSPRPSSPSNWTFRLPWPIDRLDDIPEARERQATLRAWAQQYRRVTSGVHASNADVDAIPRSGLVPRPAGGGLGSGLRGSFSSRFAVWYSERRDDDGVAHHVVGLNALVDVHVRVVRARVVLDRILDELKPRQSDGVERLVIGAARCCGSSASSCRGS